MNSMERIDRRRFLAASGALLAASPILGSATGAPDSARHEICVFTKPFQSLSYDELAERMAELGFDGVEATVREGGHIEPEAAPDELPKMVEALKKHGLKMTIMTSSINEVNRVNEAQLRTAAGLGVKRYRTKYFKYDFLDHRDPKLVPRHLEALRSDLKVLRRWLQAP